MADIPLIMTKTGPQPTPPATLNAQLLANVAASVPGYTATLPGSLIEDISSTDTAALYQIDQSRIDLVNSITPYGANIFILSQLCLMAGVPGQGQPNNTSVYVIFSGQAGTVIPPGFTVSDTTHSYVVQDGGVVGTGGVSLPIFCLAALSGSWAVAANTVTTITTSLPTGSTLTVNNPQAGTPGGTAESNGDFRARAMQAYMCTAQGMIQYLKSNLLAVPNVQARLIAVQQSTTNYKILCGGGDPYQIAYAIFKSMFWLPGNVGSGTPARNITVNIYSYPDVYTIIFVNPFIQTVTMTVTWTHLSTANFVDPNAVAQLVQPALTAYVNSIAVGQPINLLEMDAVFQAVVAPMVAIELISNITYVVSIGGVVTAPIANTRLIPSDAEGYFFSASNGITIVAG